MQPKTKQRTVHAYQTMLILKDKKTGEKTRQWNHQPLFDLLTKIIKLPVQERNFKDVIYSEWTLHLESLEIVKLSPGYIKGYFHSTKDGLRTKLQNFVTGETKDNPKAPGDNEIRTTCFTFRLDDGLFLLGEYGDNVATAKRVSEYINWFSQHKFKSSEVCDISLEHLISKDFLDKLNAFERINILELTVDTTARTSKVQDAISCIEDELKEMNQGQVQLSISKRDLMGLKPAQVTKWVMAKMKQHVIVQGKIKGKPSPGNPKELRLMGMGEKYPIRLPVDKEGEILTERLFEFIIEIVGNRSKLTS